MLIEIWLVGAVAVAVAAEAAAEAAAGAAAAAVAVVRGWVAVGVVVGVPESRVRGVRGRTLGVVGGVLNVSASGDAGGYITLRLDSILTRSRVV